MVVAKTKAMSAALRTTLPPITIGGEAITVTGYLYAPTTDGGGEGLVNSEFRSQLLMNNWFAVGTINARLGRHGGAAENLACNVLVPLSETQLPEAILNEHKANPALRSFTLSGS